MKKFILLTFLSVLTLSLCDPLYADGGSKSHAKLYENSYNDLHKQITKGMKKYNPEQIQKDIKKYLPE